MLVTGMPRSVFVCSASGPSTAHGAAGRRRRGTTHGPGRDSSGTGPTSALLSRRRATACREVMSSWSPGLGRLALRARAGRFDWCAIGADKPERARAEIAPQPCGTAGLAGLAVTFGFFGFPFLVF